MAEGDLNELKFALSGVLCEPPGCTYLADGSPRETVAMEVV